MFGWFQDKVEPVDEAIAELVVSMKSMNGDEIEYDECMKQLERLYALKENNKRRISPDTLAIVIGNLVGILIIVKFERGAVMVSKAKDYVLKTR
jgi:hypothetical protein